MIVEFRQLAREHAAARRAWWVANRPAASAAFDEELADVVRELELRPASLPVLLKRDGFDVRRRLMPRTACHVYYLIHDERGVVEIVALWGASMGRRPPLAKTPR